ncbi:hypothetical protein GCM10010988_38780 [Cnuibacter physcomitrellae]|uniref:Uncharacterized protein n=1 Tax=Cnuibacter physcomitrellae TaxID=1619308 RepID=A0A1X9LQW6_9MICO|nr:hypothetical protein B5808_19460 [Cnuibacter physcomitrellae]GGI42388.1 hypothetical protein GCM10010988_38780 [Cnuibacter physcomitrellae]
MGLYKPSTFGWLNGAIAIVLGVVLAGVFFVMAGSARVPLVFVMLGIASLGLAAFTAWWLRLALRKGRPRKCQRGPGIGR